MNVFGRVWDFPSKARSESRVLQNNHQRLALHWLKSLETLSAFIV